MYTLYIFVCIYLYIYFMCMYVCICIYVCVYIFACIYLNINMYVYVCIFKYVYVYVSMYIYIYIYVYICMYIHIDACICVSTCHEHAYFRATKMAGQKGLWATRTSSPRSSCICRPVKLVDWHVLQHLQASSTRVSMELLEHHNQQYVLLVPLSVHIADTVNTEGEESRTLRKYAGILRSSPRKSQDQLFITRSVVFYHSQKCIYRQFDR